MPSPSFFEALQQQEHMISSRAFRNYQVWAPAAGQSLRAHEHTDHLDAHEEVVRQKYGQMEGEGVRDRRLARVGDELEGEGSGRWKGVTQTGSTYKQKDIMQRHYCLAATLLLGRLALHRDINTQFVLRSFKLQIDSSASGAYHQRLQLKWSEGSARRAVAANDQIPRKNQPTTSCWSV
jgi:hypothetical protein